VITGRHVRAQFLERLGEGRRGRVGDELVPADADLVRRRQHAGNQIDDAVSIERRARRPQQMRQPAPIRLCRQLCHFCRHWRHRPLPKIAGRTLPCGRAWHETCCIATILFKSRTAPLTCAWLDCDISDG